jgi:dTDP-4-amino-4,6-dideoxygalactose transaminase
VKHCIGVANGTDALEIALRAAGVGPGDEVIVPVNSFVATALAVARAGAVPVLVDCDPDHHLIDLREVARKIGPRTRAIVPVHLYGQMAPMEELEDLVRGSGVVLVEDAAQAHGATRHGRAPGACGIAAGTSFYPGKNLGAYGDAGAILTNDETIDRRARALRNYGSEVKYVHPELGFNSRLDPLQAVVLSAKLVHLRLWNEQRREAARRYDALLAGAPGVRLPATLPGNDPVWHLYVVRVPRRDEVLAKLHAAGIQAAVHYPTPIHLQGAFRSLGHRRGEFPVAEAAAADVLSLPIYPGITPAQQERVAAVLRAAVDERRGLAPTP